MHTVAVLALDDTIAFDLATPIEIFGRTRLANGAPAYEVLVAGPSPTASAGPLLLGVPHGLDALGQADTIVVPGRNDPSAPVSADVIRALKDAHARGARIASICVGAFTLAATGLNFDHVVKETIYTTDLDAFLKSSSIRFEFYSKDHLPATAWVQVQRLIDPGFMVQVDVIAELP